MQYEESKRNNYTADFKRELNLLRKVDTPKSLYI